MGDYRQMRVNSFILLRFSSLPQFLIKISARSVGKHSLHFNAESINNLVWIYQRSYYNQYYCTDLPRGHNTGVLLHFPKPGCITQQLKKIHIQCKVSKSSFCFNTFLDMFILLTYDRHQEFVTVKKNKQQQQQSKLDSKVKCFHWTLLSSLNSFWTPIDGRIFPSSERTELEKAWYFQSTFGSSHRKQQAN